MADLTVDLSTRVWRIGPRDFEERSFKNTTWALTLRGDKVLKDLESEEVWAHVAPKLTPGDLIEVRNEKHTLYALLHVYACEDTWAQTDVILKHDRKEKMVAKSSPLDAIWNIGNKCWDVVRLSDKEVLRAGFPTKELALEWIGDHVKAMAA